MVPRVVAVSVAVLIALSVGAVLVLSGNDGGPDGPVSVSGTRDTFDRANQTEGLGAGALDWAFVGGSWGVADEQAYVASPGGNRNHALVDLGGGDGSVEVMLTKVTGDAGLVFRYKDDGNYWIAYAVPYYATWAIVKTVDNTRTVVGNTGLSSIGDGTVLGVRLDGRTIEVAVNGKVTRKLSDPDLADATRAGLSAGGSAARDARFDDFRVSRPGGQPLVRRSSG